MLQHEFFSKVFKANIFETSDHKGFYDVYSGDFIELKPIEIENIEHNVVTDRFKKLYNVEHIIPGSIYGKRDDIFYDLHNSVPSVKFINDYRSNLPINIIPTGKDVSSICKEKEGFDISSEDQRGKCPSFSIGVKEGVHTHYNELYKNNPKPYKVSGCVGACYFEPANTSFRGVIARSILYFNDKYRKYVKKEELGKYLSLSILQTMKKWNLQYPPTEYEISRNYNIFKMSGVPNKFFLEAMRRTRQRKAMKDLLNYAPESIKFEIIKKV